MPVLAGRLVEHPTRSANNLFSGSFVSIFNGWKSPAVCMYCFRVLEKLLNESFHFFLAISRELRVVVSRIGSTQA